MIEIINSMGEWEAYINSTLYASAKTLKALMSYLNAHVPEMESRVTISFADDDRRELRLITAPCNIKEANCVSV